MVSAKKDGTGLSRPEGEKQPGKAVISVLDVSKFFKVPEKDQGSKGRGAGGTLAGGEEPLLLLGICIGSQDQDPGGGLDR